MLRVAGIIKNSVVNGIGIRDVLFLQGCEHRCKGCHNPETWNKEGGEEVHHLKLMYEFKGSRNMTISGGEPLLQYNELLRFMHGMNELYNTRFWLYTGFTIEEIPIHRLHQLSRYVDVIVDGRFEEDKKDLTLRFRGSSNQRIIDLKKTLEQNKIVLWEE